MNKILLAIFVLSITFPAMAQDNFEIQYKSIVMDLSNQFSKSIKCTGGKCTEVKKQTKAEEAFELEFMAKNAKRFERLLAQEKMTNDIWTDDALYILSCLYFYEPESKFQVLEKIVNEYPDIKIELWTKNNIPYLMPDNYAKTPGVDHIQTSLRMDLYAFYGDINETKKLKRLHEETIKKLPESAEFFEIFFKQTMSKMK